MEDIRSSYKNATKRLLLLDYDGTLVDIAETPEQAVPSARLTAILAEMARDPKNEIAIISGRDQGALDTMLGHLDIGFAAEHGFFTKFRGRDWRAVVPDTASWRSAVMTLLEAATEQLPGSFIEQKRVALAWHYRRADQTRAEEALQYLLTDLQPLAAKLSLSILFGRKVVEIKPAGIDKGSAALDWLRQQDFDFILSAGDDVTDEHMFAVLPHAAFTIKIGSAPTKARQTLADPDALLTILEACLKDQ